jgi:ABC-type nitrate/sulfonate/bicarbonate transport system substrate-binding protein
MSQKRRKVSPWYVAIVLGSVLFSGCRFPEQSASNTNSMTLSVAQNSNAISYFPLYVAEQEGFIKAQGLTLNPFPPVQLGTGPKTTAAVESGSVDLAAGVITDALTLARKDSQIKLLGDITTDLNIDITVSTAFEAKTHLTASSPLTAKVKALVGKKIGITGNGAATDGFLVYLFRQQLGLDAHTDAQLENLGGSNTTYGLAALQNNSVDAIAFPSPAGQEAQLKGLGTMVISADTNRTDIPALHGLINCVLYAKQSVIEAKPKAMEAFIRALAQAETFLRRSSAQSLVLLQKYLNVDKSTTRLIAEALMASFPATPTISQQAYNEATQFHVDDGLLADPPLYSSLADASTIQQALSGLPHSS